MVTAKSPAPVRLPLAVMSRPARSDWPFRSPRRKDVEPNTDTSMPSLDDHTTRSPKKMLVTFAPAAEPVNVTSWARKSCWRRILTAAAPAAARVSVPLTAVIPQFTFFSRWPR